MRMVTIEIDEDLYDYLRNNINDFGETPNSILRRLLGFKDACTEDILNIKVGRQPIKKIKIKRNPQTSLSTLVREKMLNSNEELRLIVNGKELCRAEIDGDSVRWLGDRYSMSGLAVKFLQDEGYETEHARGPAYWFTLEGKSIKELWDQFLNEHPNFK